MILSNDGLVPFHYKSYGIFFYTKIGSIISIEDLTTTNIIESEKLISRKDKFRPFFFDIQSDENSFFEVFKVPKTKGVALDKFDGIISDFQFGVRIGQFKGIDNFLVIFEKCFKDSLKNLILCVFLILRFLAQSLLVFNAVNKIFTIV